MMEYTELGACCNDCLIAINNDDYSGMDEETELRVKAGIARVDGDLVTGEDLGFMWSPCDICNALAGDRNEVGILTPESVAA